MRRNFSLVARYSLNFSRFSLLVKPLVTHCKICSLLVAEVVCCKKSLVTRCEICLLLVAEVARFINSLVTRCRSCSLQKNRSLLVAEFARYLLQKLLVAKSHSLLVAKFAHYLLQKLPVIRYEKNREQCLFKANKNRRILFIYSLFLVDKNRKRSHNKISIPKI